MPAETKPAILSVGRLYCDLIFTDLPRLPTLGTEVFTDGFGAHAGGGAFITAAYLSMLGHGSSLAAMIPSSPFADLMRPDLEASGVDLTLCATLPPGKGAQVTVAMAQSADRAFLTRQAGPAFPNISAADLTRRQIRHIHIGEVASLLEQPDVISLARSVGATISADCGWDDRFSASALAPLISAVDVFLPNEAEMAALSALGIADTIAPVTVVKQGKRGARVVSQNIRLEAPAFPADALDTTGAGDAFNAGFLSRWMMGQGLLACLETGNRLGGLAVQNRGGFGAETGQALAPTAVSE